MEDLLQLIRSDAASLEQQFKDASIQGRGTSQEVAEFREHALQGFLKDYFPFPYRVAKGGIVDPNGRRSASVDCVLVHPDHPYIINRHEKFRLILADGVDVAIEVKPEIQTTSELWRGLRQGLSVKALRRKRAFVLSSKKTSEEWLCYSERVPFYIFAMRAKRNILETAKEVLDFYRSEGVAPLDQADAIVINGVGILANFPVPGLFPWSVKPDGRDTGWFFEEWGDNTLAGLLFKIDKLIPPRMAISESILSRYLERIELDGLVPLG